MAELIRRLWYLLNRRRFDRELQGDLEFHREMAAREGRQNLGNTLRIREEAREAWGWTWIDRFRQDVRYAARILAKSPGFTLGAVLTLAIGIGVNVAAFGFFDLLVLRPLNVKDPATLLRFHRRSPQNYAYALPYPEMDYFRKHSRTLSAVLGLNSTKVSIEGEEKQLEAHFVTANFFQELGAPMRIGRGLDPAEDERPSAQPVVVLSQDFWERHFGGDASILGRTIRLNDKPATIIGVSSRQFSGLSVNDPALWAPIYQQPYFASGSRLLTDYSVESPGVQMWGRLQSGLPPKAAEDELKMLAADLRRTHSPQIWENEGLPSQPGGYATSLRFAGRRGSGAEDADPLYAVFGLVGALVLLILAVACANLGGLLMARGLAREREMAIRTAVGAGSGRLVRQLLTESLLLAMLGSATGLVVGYFVLQALMKISGAPGWLDPAPDWRVAVFALAAGFGAAILFGLAPALQIARGRRRTTFRQFLVGAQVAGSCVLLIVASLLARAIDHAMTANPGFEYRRVLTIDPGLAKHGYSPARAQAYLNSLRNRLLAMPGVESVSLALTPPLGNGSNTAGMNIDGHSVTLQMQYVDPQFFHTMKIPLLRGRNLIPGDTHEIVVSQSFAPAWPGGDPLGKTLEVGGQHTVVGVAGSARLIRMQDSDSVEVYLPIPPNDLPSAAVVVRTFGPPEDLAQSIAKEAKALAPDTFPEVQLLNVLFRRKLESAQYSALAVSVCGFVANLLACLGIVGVVAYAVSQRTKEIGIRMALGAKPWHVLGLFLSQFARPVAAGLVAGVGGAASLSRLLRGQLFGISNFDPAAYLAAIGLFLMLAVLATVWPARRALGIDPLRALRHE